ncbi:MAG: transporter substrate-binding domain-containing protein [Spirochaetales bacterium]|nr:transporter substrate-binding domain-containing protein [Spirochaetales bacterium]
MANVAAAEEPTVVRVGFFQSGHFMEFNDDGTKTGYAYECLQNFAGYAGWQYEYVYGDFDELYNKLLRGEIDLLPDVSMTQERKTQLLFSEYPMGVEDYYIYAKPNDLSVRSDDLSSLNGKRIATISGTYQNQLLQRWMRDNSLTMQVIPCRDTDETYRKLQEGSADLVLGVNLMSRRNVSQLIRIGGSDYYICINKSRTDLIEQLNHAMRLMHEIHPMYYYVLQNKYLSSSVTKRHLSLGEESWLAEHNVIRVGCLDNYFPFCAYDAKNGKHEGILDNLMQRMISRLSCRNVSVAYTYYKTQQELMEALAAGSIDLMFPVYHNVGEAEQNNILHSDIVASSVMTALYKGRFSEKSVNVIAADSSKSDISYIYDHFPHSRVLSCNSPEEAVNAVIRGKAGSAIMQSNFAQQLLDKHSGLNCVNLMNRCDLSFAVRRDAPALYLFINRGIATVSEREINSVATLYASEKINFRLKSFVQDHPRITLVFMLLLILIIAGLSLLAAYLFMTKMKVQLDNNKIRETVSIDQMRNTAKTKFLSNMSHDIRIPMNSIFGYTSLANSNLGDSDKVQDCLAKIKLSSNHLMSLITDMLDISRMESGNIQFDDSLCNIIDQLHDIRDIVAQDMIDKEINFYIDTSETKNEYVFFDKTRFNQVLLNILSNAVKFTPIGGSIYVRLAQTECDLENKSSYELSIRDTGIGMSKENAKHIFDMYEQKRTAAAGAEVGAGLGMAITKNIIDMSKGSIECISELGKGTQFIVKFTVSVQDMTFVDDIINEFVGKKALIVNSDFNTCVGVSKMLTRIGMQSDWTMLYDDAVDKCRHSFNTFDNFDVLIIDDKLGEYSGFDLITRLKKYIAEIKPIIIMTAYNIAAIEETAKDAGVSQVCLKPVFFSDLRESLLQALNIKHMQAAEKQEDKISILDIPNTRILLVEDNELNREIASELLKSAGFMVECAENGAEAVDMVKTAEAGYYSVILMDVQMPVMDGYEATKTIRAMDDPAKSDIKIIAMTANVFEEDRKETADSGMNGFVPKPIDLDQIINEIENVMIL